MRILWINLMVAFGCFALERVGAGGFDNNYGDNLPANLKKYLNKLMLTHFNLSLKYLHTSVGYASQNVQRPGMSKYLKALSDEHWEEGLYTLQKYFKRGGTSSDIYNSNVFEFKGENELDMSHESTLDMRVPYLKTLERLHSDSQTCTSILNSLHKKSVRENSFHDADWGHFFEEKLEKEEEQTRELKGLVTTLGKMSKSSLALHIFDSHL